MTLKCKLYTRCVRSWLILGSEMNEGSFYLCVIKNELNASLVLHTRQLKEDNGRTKT